MRNLDRPALLLAFILAVVLWAYVQVAQESSIARRTIGKVPVHLVDQQTSVKARILPDERITLTVRGRADLVNSMTADEVSADVAIGHLRHTGSVSLPVRVTLPRWVSLVGKPPKVTIAVEELEQKTFPVEPSFVLAPPAGSAVGEYVLQPETVTVQGTHDALERIRNVVVRIDPTQPMTAEAQIPPCPIDKTGERVLDVTVQQASVGVRMATTTGPTGTRAVAVRSPQLQRMPRRYLVTVAAVRPDQVTLSGEQAVLDSQPAYLDTDPINVSKLTRDTTLTVRLRIPRGLTVVEGPTVRVDVEVAQVP